MNKQASLSTSGQLIARKIKPQRPGWMWYLSNWSRWANIKGLLAVLFVAPIAKAFGLMVAYGKLEAILIRADGSKIKYGLLGYRVVTNAFVQFVVDQLQTETSVFGDFKYHDSGVGVTAENATDTDIETTDGEARATGTQAEGGSANQYQSVGTISYTTTKAITEHGLFNALTGVTLLDRTVFTAINVVNGDSIQFTYTLTLTAGS